MMIPGSDIWLSLPIRIGNANVHATKERSKVYRQAGSYYFGSAAGNPFDKVLCLGSILCPTDWIVTDEGDQDNSDVSVRLYKFLLPVRLVLEIEFELRGQCSSMARSGLISLMTFIPILASVLSFVRNPNSLSSKLLLY
jgi:hypothetical protein